MIKQDTARAKGVSCFWKTENPPTDAVSGALVTFNPDGSLNLNTGVVEIGSGGQTHLAQILAEKLQIDPGQVPSDVGGHPRRPRALQNGGEPHRIHAGHAVVRAADDILDQLQKNGAQAFGCPRRRDRGRERPGVFQKKS
jgi:CO/xanthine dehydrogenase Mo-binding subunit